MPETSSPFDQSTYQVRFDWGVDGLARLAHADVVVLVDVLGLSAAAIEAVEKGEQTATDAAPAAAALVEAAAQSGAVVVVGGLRNAGAVAAEVLAAQERRAARASVAVIAAGKPAEGGTRFAVEDLLGAGAVIDALSDRGIDHSSPEAAVTGESFRGLRRATRHLLTASGSGRALQGRVDLLHAAAAVDASTAVPVLRHGAFTAA
ncbi:2-phosphosulfolactate phosphatase [Microbacterium sp. SS28]|uniref:2-phosphosulfolactate phosphatase n=1 Tax=Microbacterium sp. SS28 TaxID=2919948 RepID=UPI001FAA3EB7|nr:2-phosphosulfolactate phosphatase [Microbacterium sp. SS28]